jgi:hypothetical protein
VPTEPFFNSCFAGGGNLTRTAAAAGATVQWTSSVANDTGTYATATRYNGPVAQPTVQRAGVNAVLTISGTHPKAVLPTRFCLGAGGRSTIGGMVGQLGPLLLYQGNLSDDECNAACNGLLSWYGLARLP